MWLRLPGVVAQKSGEVERKELSLAWEVFRRIAFGEEWGTLGSRAQVSIEAL